MENSISRFHSYLFFTSVWLTHFLCRRYDAHETILYDMCLYIYTSIAIRLIVCEGEWNERKRDNARSAMVCVVWNTQPTLFYYTKTIYVCQLDEPLLALFETVWVWYSFFLFIFWLLLVTIHMRNSCCSCSIWTKKKSRIEK